MAKKLTKDDIMQFIYEYHEDEEMMAFINTATFPYTRRYKIIQERKENGYDN